nr:phenylalanine--tRNA ligase subunit alpha [Actinomycetota bacterium]
MDMDHELKRIEAAASLDELRSVEADLLGKRSELARRNAALGALGPEERKAVGQELNEARTRLQAAVDARRAELEQQERRRRLATERLDLTEVLPGRRVGHLHLVTQAIQELEDVFVGMGFTVAEGPVVETDWYNFEALNFPAGHPARNMYDTLYVELGEAESILLRTHTSPVQV